jgi:hypothetical protein
MAIKVTLEEALKRADMSAREGYSLKAGHFHDFSDLAPRHGKYSIIPLSPSEKTKLSPKS